MAAASRALADAPAASWRARLELQFDRDGPRTRLARRSHEGPLVVQRPLYPEGEAVCQCVVVHPPAGIAGGDRLEIAVDAARGARVQLTTPGAAKWYRAAGRRASQRIDLRVGEGALLEWLPQGAIVFDGVDGASDMRVELAAGGAYLGWDIVCLGRTASAERFREGSWRQCIEIVRDGALVWSERVALRGDDPLLRSQAGLNGAPVFGTFVAMAARFDDDLLAACRGESPAHGEGVVTRLPHAFVGRYRGDSSEAAHDYFRALWARVRPHVAGRDAVPPRIWKT